MKTIAVVRLPYYDDPKRKEIKEHIENKLSDYIVLTEFHSANDKISIEFFSPEIQAGLKKETCGIRNYTIIDTEKMMQGINSIPRRNR